MQCMNKIVFQCLWGLLLRGVSASAPRGAAIAIGEALGFEFWEWWPNSDFLLSVLPGDHLWPYKSHFEEALARQSGKEPSRDCQNHRQWICQIMSNQLLSLSQLWRPTRRIQRALLTPRRKFTHYRLDLCTGNSYEIYCMRSQRYFLRILRQQCRLGMDNYNLYSLEGVAWCMFWRRKDVTWCDPSRIELYLCLFRFFDLFCSAPVIHCS